MIQCKLHPHSSPETSAQCRMDKVESIMRRAERGFCLYSLVKHSPPLLTQDPVPVYYFYTARKLY